jgi:hypothetical protein
MLFHELNNGTMQTAMDFHPKLRDAFSVCIYFCCSSYRRNNTLFQAGLVPVASAENATHPYEETNISYPTYEQCKLQLG